MQPYVPSVLSKNIAISLSSLSPDNLCMFITIQGLVWIFMRLQEWIPCIDETIYSYPFFPILQFLFAHEKERMNNWISLWWTIESFLKHKDTIATDYWFFKAWARPNFSLQNSHWFFSVITYLSMYLLYSILYITIIFLISSPQITMGTYSKM